MGSFTAGGGAEVKSFQGRHHLRGEVGAYSLFKEHGGGFLHVISAGMEERIGREQRPAFQIAGGRTPWDGIYRKSGRPRAIFDRVEADTEGRFTAEGFFKAMQEGVVGGGTTQLFEKNGREC
jgi:hypothetical protein